jgi:hypothetical protein
MDTLLTAATPSELAQYFGERAKMDPGTVWDGILRPMLDALPAEVRDELLDKLETYHAPSGEFRTDEDGRLATTGASDPVTPDDINASNAAFWEDRLRGTRDSGRRITRVAATPESINEANKRFWNERS